MAAADTAASSGTRRAVASGKRFMQCQHDLSSNGAACEPRDIAKSNVVTMYQRRGGNLGKRSVTRKAKEESQADIHGFSVKAKAKLQQLQEQEHDLHGQRIASQDHQVKRVISPSQGAVCLQQAEKDHQQQSEQQLPPSEPVKRRRRRCGLVADEGPQPSRLQGCVANVAVQLPNTRGSKRSSRLLAKKLAIKEPTMPAPLRLPKLHVVLNRKEIHDDWLKITGQRYVGKPRKSVLNQLGLGLCASLTCPSSIRYFSNPESKP